jgi:hypothetical protein
MSDELNELNSITHEYRKSLRAYEPVSYTHLRAHET